MRTVSRVPHVVSALCLGLCFGILMTWSMFRSAFLDLFPSWTAGDLSIIYSIHNIANAAMVFGGGLLLRNKVKPQYLIRTAACLLGGGLFLISFLPTDNEQTAFAMLSVCYGIIAALGVGTMNTTLITTYIKWFPDREGFINGIVMLPCMTASLVFGAAVQRLIPAVGLLRTFRILGVFVFVVIMAGSFWVTNPGPDILLPPRPAFTENRGDRDFSVKEAMVCPAFWAVLLFRFAFVATGLIYTDYAASIAEHFHLSSLVGMLYAPVAGIACIVVGLMLNRFRVLKSWCFIEVIIALGVLLLTAATLTSAVPLAILGILCIGFIFGSINATMGAVVRILFGSRNNAMIYGIISSLSTFLSALIGALSGKLLDSMGGSYYGIFLIMGILVILGLICLIFMARYFRKEAAPPANP